MFNKNKKIFILGAGPSGLTAAYFYLEKGYDITVIEKSENYGGLSRSIFFNDQKYDLGPHSFYNHYSYTTKSFFEKFIPKGNYSKKKAIKLVQTSSALFKVPFHFSSIFRHRNFLFFINYTVYRCFGLMFNKNKNETITNQGVWFHEKIFKPYCKKYFNLEPEDVSEEFEQLLQLNKNQNKEDLIYVPNSGRMGELWDAVYSHLSDQGVRFVFNQQVKNLSIIDDKITFIETENHAFQDIELVVSSIPITEMLQLVFPNSPKQTQLKTRATIVVYIEVDQVKTQALYLTNYCLENTIGRISFCSNWKKQETNKKNVISVEIWCDNKDEIFFAKDQEIISRILNELEALDLVIIGTKPHYKVIKIERCFPVLKKGFKSKYDSINQKLAFISNLRIEGRQGKFQWDGLDDVINSIYHG